MLYVYSWDDNSNLIPSRQIKFKLFNLLFKAILDQKMHNTIMISTWWEPHSKRIGGLKFENR